MIDMMPGRIQVEHSKINVVHDQEERKNDVNYTFEKKAEKSDVGPKHAQDRSCC